MQVTKNEKKFELPPIDKKYLPVVNEDSTIQEYSLIKENNLNEQKKQLKMPKFFNKIEPQILPQKQITAENKDFKNMNCNGNEQQILDVQIKSQEIEGISEQDKNLKSKQRILMKNWSNDKKNDDEQKNDLNLFENCYDKFSELCKSKFELQQYQSNQQETFFLTVDSSVIRQKDEKITRKFLQESIIKETQLENNMKLKVVQITPQLDFYVLGYDNGQIEIYDAEEDFQKENKCFIDEYDVYEKSVNQISFLNQWMIVTYDDGFMRIYYFKLDNKSDDKLINVDINFIKFNEFKLDKQLSNVQGIILDETLNKEKLCIIGECFNDDKKTKEISYINNINNITVKSEIKQKTKSIGQLSPDIN